VRQEPLERLLGQLAFLDAEACRIRREEVLRERHEIQRSLAQRRDREVRDVKAIVEILPESSVGDRLLEVRVRRHDEAHVNGNGPPRPDPHHLVLLQDAQKLHLCRERQVGDLVEEERPPVGCLEPPGLARKCARERTLLVPEELALDERGGERAAVDGDEGRARPQAAVVNVSRDDLLSGAGLARNEDGGARRGNPLDLAQQLARERILEDKGARLCGRHVDSGELENWHGVTLRVLAPEPASVHHNRIKSPDIFGRLVLFA
jgi:hypothetical protein